MAITTLYKWTDTMEVPGRDASYWSNQWWSSSQNSSQTQPSVQPTVQPTGQPTWQKATVWNPSTWEKKVITSWDAMPTWYSLWTWWTATWEQARQAIMWVEKRPVNINPAEWKIDIAPTGSTWAWTWDWILSSATPIQQWIMTLLEQQKEELTARTDEYKSQLESAQKSLNEAVSNNQIIEDYKTYKTQQEATRKDLSNTLNELNTLNTQMATEIANMKQTWELWVIVQGRIQIKQEEYAARISWLSAKAKILQDDISWARDDFNTYYNVASQQRSEQLNNLTTMFNYAKEWYFDLSKQEKDAITNQINYLNTLEQQQTEDKKTLLNLMATYPTAFAKGKVLPTDNLTTAMEKMQPFMNTEVQSQAVQKLIAQYPDALIGLQDSLAEAQSKVQNSALYRASIAKNLQEIITTDEWWNEVKGYYDTTAGWFITPTSTPTSTDSSVDPITWAKTDPSKVIKWYNFTSYAKDPNWWNEINNKLSSIWTVNSVSDIEKYIVSTWKAKWTSATKLANDIWSVAQSKGVDAWVLTAILYHESWLTTSNVAKNNNNPWGVTWNANYPESMKWTARPASEGWNYVKFATMADWIAAVADNIARRKQTTTWTTRADVTAKLDTYSNLSEASKKALWFTYDANWNLVDNERNRSILAGLGETWEEKVSNYIGQIDKVSNVPWYAVTLMKSIKDSLSKTLKTWDENKINKELDSYAYKVLKWDQKKDFDNKAKMASWFDQILKDTSKIVNTNLYRNTLESLKQLAANPKAPEYVKLFSKIEQLQAQYRNALFGATLTGNELKSAEKFTITNRDTAADIINKLTAMRDLARRDNRLQLDIARWIQSYDYDLTWWGQTSTQTGWTTSWVVDLSRFEQ